MRIGPVILAALVLAHATGAWAQDESRPLRDLSVARSERPDAAPPRKEMASPPPLFTEWSLEGSGSSWSGALGFEQTADGLRPTRLSPSWLALGPAWQFTVRARTNGPGGVRFTARAGGSGGQRLPAAAVDVLEPNASPAFTELDPAMRQTVWSAGLGVDRTFTLGRVDLTLFGEALLVTGRLPGKSGPPNDRKPVRTTAGLRVKF